MNLESRLLSIIRGEKKAPMISSILAVLSQVYRSLVAIRNLGYDRGLLPSFPLSVPVISIGNIVAGGTGKTPLVHLLASELQDHMRLSILTRGYRSQLEKKGGIHCVSSGQGPLLSAAQCGDEPYFLAQKTKAAIWVGADRVQSGKKAIEAQSDCLVLDDGMQHRRLKRDFEIVIVDAMDPLSKGRFLPWGLLRDSPKRLKKADLIVITHVKDLQAYQKVQNTLAPLTSAPMIGTQMQVLNSEAFPARKVGLFCGIGQPARFLQTARDLNQEIVDTFIVKDHGSLQMDSLQAFARSCRTKGAEALLCTEKDYVKLPPSCSIELDIVPVSVQLKIIAGHEHWKHLIENILDKVVK